MRWSNDRLKATLHKVEAPPNRDADGTVPERYSIAFFCNANKDVELKCLDTCCSEDMPAKYAPINAHNYITQRLLDTINTSAAKEQSEEKDPNMLSSSSTPNKLIQVVADDAENGTSITYTTVSSRMCRVCQQHQAKYTCPRCQLPYCSIDCYCNHNSSSNNNANDSSSSGVSSCTEEFYKSKVNAVLSLEQKEQDGQKMLNRHYQQQKLGGGTEGQEDMLEEEELYELWCKLEELGEDATQAQLDKLIPASLKRMFQQDLQQGAVQKLVLQSWYPWWRQQLVTVEEQEEGDNDTEEELVRSNSRRRSKTLDERLLELPPFESLSGGRPPSHLLVFNLIEVLYAICEVLILYHGSDNAIANEAVEAASTLISASAVLSKDARFSSLSEVLIHSTRGGKGDANAVTPWDTLVDDVASIVNSNRLVGRALLEALDVLTAARKEIKHWQEAKERQQHLEQLKKLGALRKKLEFFLSWSQDAEIKMMLKESSLKDEIQSWKVEVLAIQEEENRQNP
jgi:HIT zinc finger